jgi:hypothetical protein
MRLRIVYRYVIQSRLRQLLVIQPADIYVLCGLLASDEDGWTYRELATDLGVPHALVQRALKRADTTGLYSSASKSIHRANLEEFLLHSVRFVAPAKLGTVVPGVPAAWAAPPMSEIIHESGELPPVWPSAAGKVRGQALPPLHDAAILAVDRLPRLGELLAIVDSLRAGDVRIRSVAADFLTQTLRRQPISR